MPGENQRSLTTILLAGGAFLALYYAGSYLLGGDSAEPTPEVETSEPVATEDTPRAETREEVLAAQMRRRDDPARLERRQTATITTDQFVATIDNLSGGVESLLLQGERFHVDADDQPDRDGEPMDIVTTSFESYRPLRVATPGADIPLDAVWELEQESPTSVRLHWEGDGLAVDRHIRAGDGPYQMTQSVEVRNTANYARRLRLRVGAYHYVEREEEGGGMFSSRSPKITSGLCAHDGEVERKVRDDLEEGAHAYGGAVDFVGIEDVYFVQALAPVGEAAEYCGMSQTTFSVSGEEHGSLFETGLVYPAVALEPGASHSWETLSYFGPKDVDALEAAGHNLPEVVNLGMFAFIARGFAWLLRRINEGVGNWGLAIIILTMMVRLCLFPLTQGNFRVMAQMRRLKPEMDEITKKYSDDMEKKNAAVMELYRKHGMSPFAQLRGCLPLVLQMPVFFALYASLSTNVELYHQPFALWWTDLSAPDPWYVLPVALGGLMYVQQQITPNSMDPAQQKIMRFMPLIVTSFMLFLPAGLCLYMLTNSVLAISQQGFNEYRIRREQAATPAVVAETSDSDGSGSEGTSPREDSSVRQRPGKASRGAGRSRRG